MSAEAAVYALLSASAPVVAVVGDRIYPHHIPQEVRTLPALVYDLISAVPEGNIDALQATHVTQSRVQVSMIGRNAEVLHNTLRDAVVGALRNQRGTFGSTEVHAILLDHDGTPTFDPQSEIWHRPIDFFIIHQQP